LENFLDDTVLATEAAKNKFLKKAAKDTKSAVLKHIPRTVGKRLHSREVRLVDDVQARLVKDKIFGGERVRVRGGKHTGTLWHIVNNGTYRSKATHFMDKAIADVEAGLDANLDIALSDEFGR